MARVSIRLREGASHFDVSVQAQSIRRAVGIAADRYPNADVRVSFTIDAEDSLARKLAPGPLGSGVSGRKG